MKDIVLREIESQLSTDTDLLLRMLASSQSLGASAATVQDGRVVFDNAKRTFRQSICVDHTIKTIYGTAKHSKTELVTAVLDAIAGLTIGFSPITIAVLIVREGMDTLCKECWANE